MTRSTPGAATVATKGTIGTQRRWRRGPKEKNMTTPEPASPDALTPALPHRRPLREIVLYFLRLGTLGFGGPMALVGLMEKELVSERQWLTRDEMRNAVAVSQTLPVRSRSRSASSSPICGVASGARGPAAGPLSCQIS